MLPIPVLASALLVLAASASATWAQSQWQAEGQNQNSSQNQNANQQYYINGKPISRGEFDAFRLLNESVPLLQRNQNQEAADKLTRAAQLAPQVAEIRNNLGLALAKLGRNNEALNELEQAKALNPGLAATWMTLGGLYQSQGRVVEAINTYSEFLTRFPSHKDAPKIASLVAGLKKEVATEGLGAVNPNADNYLAEMRNGLRRWPLTKMPIRVYIAPGNGVDGWNPRFDQVLGESFGTWQQASQNKVCFKPVTNPAEADLKCSWTSNSGTFKNRAEAGETTLMANSQGIVGGTISILTVPLMPELPVTENRLRLICLHEIGHALGFGGHTTNPQDVMFYSSQVSDQARTLSQRDIISLRLLYGSAPGSGTANAPATQPVAADANFGR